MSLLYKITDAGKTKTSDVELLKWISDREKETPE